ncbi:MULTISPECIES: hypothetical protein [unclassified Thiocapsa]|uniref:hypothetical protein n=1 Tax=unclassified Thiocapsa TaxID=2641286 RepID=UPI0035B0F5C1
MVAISTFGSVAFLPRYRPHLGQQIAELAVVDLDAVVRIQGDALVGVMAQFFVIAAQLVERLGELVALLLQSFGPGAAAAALISAGGDSPADQAAMWSDETRCSRALR